MRDYESIREEWIHLRKIPGVEKYEVDFVKQATLGLIIDKVDKMCKNARKGIYDDYVESAIKSEYKQTLDALNQGVDCQIQVDILEALMPQTLTHEEISSIIIAILARYEKPNMGIVMKELGTFDGMDMSIASKLVKELL